MLSLAQTPSSLTPPPHFFAISVSAAAVCLVLALLLRWKPLRRLEFVKPWLYLLAGIGFAGAFLTSWANTAMDFARTIPLVGGGIPVAAALILAYIVLYDLWPRHPSNTVTEVSALLLPSVSSAMGGSLGGFLTSAISTVAVTGGGILGKAFGV